MVGRSRSRKRRARDGAAGSLGDEAIGRPASHDADDGAVLPDMRILFVVPYVPSLIRVRPYQFIRALAARHEVSVLASAAGREVEDAAALRPICRRIEIVPRRLAESVRRCALAAAGGEPLQGAVCRSAALEQRLRALLAEDQFDLVHIEHLRAAYLREHIPNSLPTLFDAVDCISLLWERTFRSSHCLRQRALALLELRRTRAYEARVLDTFGRVAVTSAEDRSALLSLMPRARIAVVPNGVDLDYFRPTGEPREPATLVLSGKMSYHANVTAALYFVQQVFPLIRQARPDVRLRIVGSNPPPALRGLTRDAAISVTGYVPDIREYVGRSTVAVCPIMVKVGIQNKLLEAMAMGLPVVSTAQGIRGLADDVERSALVADSPSEFAAHVCRLLDDPSLRARLGAAGRRYVEEHHRWDTAARQLEALYAESISSQLDRPPGSGRPDDRAENGLGLGASRMIGHG